ncbi:MAG TPA: S-methyl-5-thioribose-1-phosphate isomerase [Leptospiraceae bacterium]|nr:S-methyl-5-thioribose-1-phosphate isomerase [Leptospiraceae bacterium]HMW07119.1 S-methyl-5-thioribose-1-phosphate isomerase [Leptospiraceae bacterium]HMX31793.1 S-methyl-5-thioribose-1-phosphate isomerase [Leptospiraceae bacterium]HMY32564.1 S-methyl-5-thioribose-1-phosphate isomerase [Leptospiraceae bacterium]HMZ63902.1 S-methyl-5-thioribose-1-phosphate isomerase [Leptospiraceae bacterium]
MKTQRLILKSIDWKGDRLSLLDQRKIPLAKEYIDCMSLEDVIFCIKSMVVRGAPAIAMSGIFGLVLELKNAREKLEYEKFIRRTRLLLESRPTAVNLRLAVEDYLKLINEKTYSTNSISDLIKLSEKYAISLLEQDLHWNLEIGKNGLKLFSKRQKEISILTHCNTGALATAGHGTAIGIIRSLRDAGYKITVYADETRPYQQGSRLTAWEMQEEKINCFIIAEGMSAWLFQNRKIDAVIVGADRIAPNGDTANKIGTYALSIVAKENKIPFYVAATKTSFDFTLKDGSEIPIEMREEEELTQNSFLKDLRGNSYLPKGILAPLKARALNPAFDVTPAKYISAIVTEHGIIQPVNKKEIKRIVG